MSNITAVLLRERDTKEGRHVQVYKIGKYLLTINGEKESTGDNMYVDIRLSNDTIIGGTYLPILRHRCFDDDGVACNSAVYVEPRHKRAISPGAFAQFMIEMREGMDVAEYIRDTFLRRMVAGNWNWTIR